MNSHEEFGLPSGVNPEQPDPQPESQLSELNSPETTGKESDISPEELQTVQGLYSQEHLLNTEISVTANSDAQNLLKQVRARLGLPGQTEPVTNPQEVQTKLATVEAQRVQLETKLLGLPEDIQYRISQELSPQFTEDIEEYSEQLERVEIELAEERAKFIEAFIQDSIARQLRRMETDSEISTAHNLEKAKKIAAAKLATLIRLFNKDYIDHNDESALSGYTFQVKWAEYQNQDSAEPVRYITGFEINRYQGEGGNDYESNQEA